MINYSFDNCLARAAARARLLNRTMLIYIEPTNGRWSFVDLRDAMKEGIPITHWRIKVAPNGDRQLVGESDGTVGNSGV